MSVVAYLDGDIICWKAAILGETRFKIDDEEIIRIDEKKSWAIAQAMVRAWSNAVDASSFVFCVTDRAAGMGSFRHSVDPSYHANRKTMYRPPHLLELHWKLVKKYSAVFHPGLEGDDIMGILATEPHASDEKPVIVSEDKDMWCIPVGLYFPTRSKQISWVTPLQADKYWFYQALIGDPADNYKGCPGVGDKRARKALSGAKDVPALWAKTLKVFKRYGADEEYALQQVQLARILRSEDITADWKTIKLWRPDEPELFDLPAPHKPENPGELL